MKSELIEYTKQYIKRERYVLEIRIWRVDDTRYPSSLKYSLIFIEPKTGKRILMDNHHPKNPHIHINNQEKGYEYVNIQKLLKDFENLVLKHFGERI